MLAHLRQSLFALILSGLSAGAVVAGPPAEAQTRIAMLRVEHILNEMGVDVTGYGDSPLPITEMAPPDHPYLQGNDGGYAGGRIYLNEDAIAACTDLTLIHELVHDATVKRRLFATVDNARLRAMVEALADAVTARAAAEPYRPGCLPKRHFELSTLELAALAVAPPAP